MLFSQFNQYHASAVKDYSAVDSGVPVLLLASSPTAILWAVVSIIVDAVQAQAFWAFSHIVTKRLERILPPLANFNSSSAIILIGFISFIFTPTNHAFPCYEALDLSKSVRRIAGAYRIAKEASAATDPPLIGSFQVGFANCLDCSARALANPKRITVRVSASKLYDLKPIKCFTDKVVLGRREIGKIGDSHETFLCKKGLLWLEPRGVSSTVAARSF